MKEHFLTVALARTSIQGPLSSLVSPIALRLRERVFMPERPSDPPPVLRPLSDRERAEATRRRVNECKAPPLLELKPPFPVEPPMSVALADLAAWWLELRCGCGHLAYYPFRLLAAERGWQTPLSEVLPRLRCGQCHVEPATVDVVASPADGAMGAASFNAVGSGARLRVSAAKRRTPNALSPELIQLT